LSAITVSISAVAENKVSSSAGTPAISAWPLMIGSKATP
jgi:hypothetical protein